MKNKFYLTTPIYYASGPPHLGHTFTTIYADVIARFKRAKGERVFFSAGTDEHGTKISEKAKETGISEQDFVDKISNVYEDVWSKIGVSYDGFIRTTSPKHIKGVLEFIKIIHENGDLYESEYEGLYCIACERFYTPKELVNGLCPDHLIEPKKIKEKNYFFKLKKYLPKLKEMILSNELKIIPESRKNEILKMIEGGLPDFSMTREKVEWGIPFPYDKSQTIYVWGDALINYLTVLGFPKGKNFDEFWPADLHLIGADINKFHSIYWPAMLLSAKLPLPREIFAHGLIKVNGQKMSKTLGNVIDPLEIAKKFGADGLRYLILSQFPASEHGDIKENEFSKKYESDLSNGIGNLFERVAALLISTGDLENKLIDKKFQSQIENSEKEYLLKMNEFDLFGALRTVMNFAKDSDQYINEKKPWALNDKKEKDLVLNSLNLGILKIIDFLTPFMPQKTKEAQIYFNKIAAGKIKKGEKLNLFPRP